MTASWSPEAGDAAARQRLADAAFERLGEAWRSRPRVVDFVGDARGEEADAGQLLVANHLLRPLLDLEVEAVADVLESRASCR